MSYNMNHISNIYNFIPRMFLNAFLNSGLKIVYIKGLRHELM